MSVLCIPAECDNIKLPIEYEIASRWDAYLLCDICRHFASVMLHFASLITHNLRCIPAYTHQIPNGISSQTFFGTTCISILNLIHFYPISTRKKSFRFFEFSIFRVFGFFLVGGWGAKKNFPRNHCERSEKSLLQTFWCGIARSTQFHKFKLNVIACFTMKKHINHNAKLIHT